MIIQLDGWAWEEAFDKFGFNDGDDTIHTYEVISFLESLGYECEATGGIHNTYLDWIKKDGKVIECDGYEEPQSYLPKALVKKLDNDLPAFLKNNNNGDHVYLKTSDERTDLQLKACDEIHAIISDFFSLNDDAYGHYYDECWSPIDNVLYNFELDLVENKIRSLMDKEVSDG